jgi:hypothetical protein
LTVGFPAERPQASSRKPLADIVHYERFGSMSPQASAQAVHGPGGILQNAVRWLHKKLR